MKLHTILLVTLTAVLILPLNTHAQSKPQVSAYAAGKAALKKHPIALMYECSICHHQVTAAQAKLLHYICPVDHGKLIPVKTTVPSKLK